MGKFSCLSCSCFSSSSTPQQVTTVVLLPTQPSQQPSISGPSTTLLSSQPCTQPPNSTPSSSSSSQQPADVEMESFLLKFNDISRLQDLIQFTEELLKRLSGEKKEEGSSSATTSYIQDGQRFLELVDKHLGKLPQKYDSNDGPSAEIEKAAINLLKGAAQIHWVGAALSLVGFVLARYNEMSNNQKECLRILKVLVNLGKQIVELNEQMPEEKQRLNEAVDYIVQGCIMCASQLSTGKFVRFLTASVSADGFKDFEAKLDRLYKDLTLSADINIQKRIPKLASQSKVAYNPAVGIEIAQERVIELLDLNAQNASSQVVVVYGFGGIRKTTLADAVYDCIDPQMYNKCRVHMDQHCTKHDLKILQEQVLEILFNQNVKLTDYDQELGSCLPPRSRLLVTTRNLQERDIFLFWNVQRQQYLVDPLPETKARDFVEESEDYNDEKKIYDLLKLCGGFPPLLELAGAQLAKSIENANFMVLELLKTGERVEKQDISDRMVDYVYHSLLHPVREAFLDITSFLFSNPDLCLPRVNSRVEEEFRALEEASFIKRDEYGWITIHDIVQARGKKISEEEGNRITDPEVLLEFLKEEEPPIEIKDYHLKCMSNSLRVLSFERGSQITFSGRCHKPFKELRCLRLTKLTKPERLSVSGGHQLRELPSKFWELRNLRRFALDDCEELEELPSDFGRLNNLEYLRLTYCPKLKRLSLDSGQSGNLKYMLFNRCSPFNELSYSFGQLGNLKTLILHGCSALNVLPSEVGLLKNLDCIDLSACSELKELPPDIGQFQNLRTLSLRLCSGLQELPPDIGQLKNLKELDLRGCSGLKELPLSLEDLITEDCKVIM